MPRGADRFGQLVHPGLGSDILSPTRYRRAEPNENAPTDNHRWNIADVRRAARFGFIRQTNVQDKL
jgi:hypothetical protein